MDSQLKKGVLDMCILGIIMKKDSYGYDIYQSVNRILNISESTIYPILRKFVKENYCETYLIESSGGPARKYFKITAVGTIRYHELLNGWNEFKETVDILLELKK